MAKKRAPKERPAALPLKLQSAALAALKKWSTANKETRIASALLFSALAKQMLLASIGDAGGGLGGAIGAAWGARCHPQPPVPTFQMTDTSWFDDASIPSQGKTSGWRKVTVRVVRFGTAYILCTSYDVQLRMRLDVADIASQIRTWTALAQAGVADQVFPDLATALRTYGYEHLSQAGFYAHERKHVTAVRTLLQADRDGKELRTILDEASAFVTLQENEAQAKALELKGRLENRIDGDILAGFSHSITPGDSRPPAEIPTAPLPADPMPAGVTRQVWDADTQALTTQGYTLVS